MLDTLGLPDLTRTRHTTGFHTGFEAISDVGPSYITPQSETTRHELSTENVHSGARAHKAWLPGTPPSVPEVDGPTRECVRPLVEAESASQLGQTPAA